MGSLSLIPPSSLVGDALFPRQTVKDRQCAGRGVFVLRYDDGSVRVCACMGRGKWKVRRGVRTDAGAAVERVAPIGLACGEGEALARNEPVDSDAKEARGFGAVLVVDVILEFFFIGGDLIVLFRLVAG